jgi:TolB-like protein
MPATQVELGSLTLQPRRQLLADGRPLPIGRKALDILSTLAEASGELVTKDELLGAVWPSVVVEENALQVHIAALRKVLGPEAGRLATVRGLGYRLEVPEQTMSVPARPDRHSQSSVAILPLANLTSDPAKDYLANGIAQELIATLSRGTDLKVPSWTSTSYYRGRTADVRTIARQLGVETILEGWVKASADTVRVSAQLIDAASGFHIWADTFDRPFAQLFSLEDELARSIASALRAQLTPLERSKPNHEAFDLYLKACAMRTQLSIPSLHKAIELLEEATRIDGRFAQAHAALAGAKCFLVHMSAAGPSTLGEARRSAEMAVALDPALRGGHTVLAWAGLLDGNWQLAEHHSGVYDSCAMRSSIFTTVGYLRAAVVQAEHSISIDPANGANYMICAAAYWLMADYDAALQHLSMAVSLGIPVELMPGPAIRADAALDEGDHAAAAGLMEEAFDTMFGGQAGDALTRAYAAIAGKGSGEIAIASLDRFIRGSAVQDQLYVVKSAAGILMTLYCRLGSLDGAFRIAEGLIASRAETGSLDQQSLRFIWRPEMEGFRGSTHSQNSSD